MASFAAEAARGDGTGGARRTPTSFAAAGLLAASLAGLLAACSFDEARPAVEQPTPVAFSHAPGGAPAKPLPVDWPRIFGAPELTRLAALTAHDNFDVAASSRRRWPGRGSTAR